MCNVRSVREGVMTRNQDILPYRSVNDPRLSWLLDVFIPYIEQWELAIEARWGGLTKTDKNAMML